MDFAGLIEPAVNSLCINRSHKLGASTDVGQNYNPAFLDVGHGRPKCKKGGWVLGCNVGSGVFNLETNVSIYSQGINRMWPWERLMVERGIQIQESLQGLTGPLTWWSPSPAETRLWHGPWPGLTFPLCVRRLLTKGQGYWLREVLLCQFMGVGTKFQQNHWNKVPYHVKILWCTINCYVQSLFSIPTLIL